MSHFSSVGIATGWTTEALGFEVKEILLFCTASRPALGPTQPPIQWVPVVRRPGRESAHLPLASAEVKNGGVLSVLLHCLVIN
jgi:hypothetical protein